MDNTIYSLLPPLLAILMVVFTRRVLLSLAVGIVTSAFLLANFNIFDTSVIIANAVKLIFISDGALHTSNIFIMLFLLLLGMITAFISILGGSHAFGNWAMKRVKTRAGAQFVGFILGIIIFIDDYFNALAVGQVTRPITDRQNVSRAKLAYIIDSTSAPVCVISPISSWGAYIITVIGSILAVHGVSEYTAFSAFIQLIPMNFYVWASLGIVLVVIFRNFNLGSMNVHEMRAMREGQLYDPAKPIAGELKNELPTSRSGSVFDLIFPIIALIVGTVGVMIWTGYHASEGSPTILKIFENTDVSTSLLAGGLLALIVTTVMFARQAFVTKSVEPRIFYRGVIEGMKSMLPAIYILLFAWTIVDLIERLGTGKYLASVAEMWNMNSAFLPVIMFVIAGIMAFSTGTSWGSFGILLPIAGDMAVATDIHMLLPSLAAVLAGAVFGDHCSPISDTTILSSTGAGANHIDHVMTQLPYAFISAFISLIGFFIVGFTGSIFLALAVLFGVLFMFFLFVQDRSKTRTD
ncbi:Na+/H+ antiporter NhaC family protein [Pueribacillus sp. YX66]|uniref:Na+/H+ antiporter NhaC family protein n=1 Tax=Pueribacillus sp. YX66 TaxID=3229242 RepID=UPI00358D6B5B